MIRKLMVPVFAAMALVMLMSAAAFAADVPSVSPYGAGQGVYFVDADGDGVCDNTGLYLGQQSGAGSQIGAASQGGNGSCLDADGDGVCDALHPQLRPADGAGRQNGAGARRP
jgi:hypothetical protein